MAHATSIDYAALETQIIESLDLRAVYAALGVDVIGRLPNANGWLTCRAVGREDRSPSAGINVKTGHYHDFGGQGESISLWEFAAQHGQFANWRAARSHFAERAGLDPKLFAAANGQPVAGAPDPAKHLAWQPWNDVIAMLWTRQKPGVTVEALRAAGAQLATYRRTYSVIAVPIFGSLGPAAKPIGWVLWNTAASRGLPIFTGKGPPAKWAKMKTTSGSESGLIIADGVARLVQPLANPASPETVWLTEGPTDALALWASIPAERRAANIVVCNSGGATEYPRPPIAALFAGRPVCVLRDLDKAGEVGAARWTTALAAHSPDVRHVRLPGEIAPDHGRDLRDWLIDGHTFAELLDLAASAAPMPVSNSGDTDQSSPQASDADAVPESDDDPHRLARCHLASHAGTLRFWREEWWRARPYPYRKIRDRQVRAEVTRTVKTEFDRICRDRLAAVEGQDTDKEIVAQKVTRPLTTNVLAALEETCLLPADVVDAFGYWLGDPDHPRFTPGPKQWVSMTNGILQIDELLAGAEHVLLPHSPAWFSDIHLPYAFDIDSECPLWEGFLKKNLEGDAERIAVVQEWAGYCLTADTRLQKFMILEGEGSNGKSVYCAVLEALVGSENVSNVSLEMFGDRFQRTESLGKLVNISAEIGEIDKAAEGILKAFTSGDRMFFDRKGIPGLSAIPTARLTFATNNRPRFSDRSSGIWRRLLLVPWRVQIEDHEKVVGMNEAAWWHASGELPGILLWAIRGLDRLRTQGRFTASAEIEEATEEYRQESNPARSFLLEHYQSAEAAGQFVVSEVIYREYREWCDNHGHKPFASCQFGKEVMRVFRKSTKSRKGPKSRRYWVYENIESQEKTADVFE